VPWVLPPASEFAALPVSRAVVELHEGTPRACPFSFFRTAIAVQNLNAEDGTSRLELLLVGIACGVDRPLLGGGSLCPDTGLLQHRRQLRIVIEHDNRARVLAQ
jgi:hypothetical protein